MVWVEISEKGIKMQNQAAAGVRGLTWDARMGSVIEMLSPP